MSETSNASRKAIANIKWLNSTMRGLTALAEELGDVDDLQAALNQKGVELKGITAQHQHVSELIVKDLDEAKKTAASMIDQAHKEVAAIRAQGEESLRQVEVVSGKTNEIRGQAQAKADALIAEAKRRGDALVSEARRAESAVKESIKGLQENISQLQKQEADARHAESAAKARLDALNQQIAALKSKF